VVRWEGEVWSLGNSGDFHLEKLWIKAEAGRENAGIFQ